MKIGRNDPCWCGSGKKYKACHYDFDKKIREIEDEGHEVPEHYMIKTPEQIEGVRKAARINTLVLDYIEPFVKAGVSTLELNDKIDAYTRELGGIPAPLDYEGYPKSVCISVNDVVCHGIPDEFTILEDGDIVNIDCSTIYNGYFGDSSRMYLIGDVSEKKRKLVEVTKECLELGVAAVKPWGFLGDVGYAINEHAKKNGFSVVREIGGHGIGLEFHEEPWVSHIGEPDTDILLVPGMIFTIEPMINMGKADIFEDEDDGWTIYTYDGEPSAQFEYQILVTEDGVEILAR